MSYRITALVPMKGHSKRVRNKNIRSFCGKPLFFHIIERLLESKYIDKILINTDSSEISELALKNYENVHIIERPHNIRGDFIDMNTIIAYDLTKVDDNHFLQTHSTNPLLSTETIDKAIELYFRNSNRYNSLFSVIRLQTRLYWKDGSPINHNPKELLRTQDLPTVYEENSNLYIFSKQSFSDSDNNRIGTKPYLFEMSPLEAIDIDNEDDFKLAEYICSLKSK